MFGFNHYSQDGVDAAAAEAARDAAISAARDNFMARHGMISETEVAANAASSSASDSGNLVAGAAVGTVPQ